jgi:hypothetical protein
MTLIQLLDRPNNLWQELRDGDIDEITIEQRLLEGVSLEEQVAELRSEISDLAATLSDEVYFTCRTVADVRHAAS